MTVWALEQRPARPKVAIAMPISRAFGTPWLAAISGAQTMVLPWPPVTGSGM
jgi:hypothetical protein